MHEIIYEITNIYCVKAGTVVEPAGQTVTIISVRIILNIIHNKYDYNS